LQNSRQINGDNLQNSRHETYTMFKNKKKEHLKDKINKLETNKTKNINWYRSINEFRKGYQPRINITKELLMDPP
jgi:hypothetical protein